MFQIQFLELKVIDNSEKNITKVTQLKSSVGKILVYAQNALQENVLKNSKKYYFKGCKYEILLPELL